MVSRSELLGTDLVIGESQQVRLCMLEPLCHPLQRVTGVANRLRITMTSPKSFFRAFCAFLCADSCFCTLSHTSA